VQSGRHLCWPTCKNIIPLDMELGTIQGPSGLPTRLRRAPNSRTVPNTAKRAANTNSSRIGKLERTCMVPPQPGWEHATGVKNETTRNVTATNSRSTPVTRRESLLSLAPVAIKCLGWSAKSP
jgi:hypothetical protein